MHFPADYHQGPAAVQKHLEFFRFTGMDFVKVQFEQNFAPPEPVRTAQGWLDLKPLPEEAFEPTVEVVRGLAQAVRGEALVILTVYSPLMWAARASGKSELRDQFDLHPQAVQAGLEVMTENVIRLVMACKRAGADGFFISTQGGEVDRFPGRDYFVKYIKPTDLAVWDAVDDCELNILHVCDYEGPYDDLSPFVDYPGQIINSSLKAGERDLTPGEVSQMFGRPFMGGMERKGALSTGSVDSVHREAAAVLGQAPERFVLGADCTVLADAPWENLRAAVEVAHQFEK